MAHTIPLIYCALPYCINSFMLQNSFSDVEEDTEENLRSVIFGNVINWSTHLRCINHNRRLMDVTSILMLWNLAIYWQSLPTLQTTKVGVKPTVRIHSAIAERVAGAAGCAMRWYEIIVSWGQPAAPVWQWRRRYRGMYAYWFVVSLF